MRWMEMPLAMLLATTAAATEPGAKAGEDAFTRLQAEVVNTGTPRERALAAQLSKSGPPGSGARVRGGRLLRDAAASAPADPLVQWLWATAPLEATGFPGDASCAGRTWAAARLDPDNAASWTPVFAAALKAHDTDTARMALDRMAQASHYAEPFAEVVGAWRDILRRHPMPAGFYANTSPYSNTRPLSHEEGNAIAGVAFAAALVSPVHGLMTYCNAEAVPAPPAEDLARCLRIAGLMQQSPTLFQRLAGAGIQRRVSGTEVAGFERQHQWWNTASAGIERDGREALQYFDDLVSTGSEVRAIELLLQRAGKPLTPPAEWVYVSPYAHLAAAAAEKAAAEAREETGEAVTAPARPAKP